MSKSDDLISRKAAIDAIRASASKYTGFMEMEQYTDDDAVEAIEGVPPAQPEDKCGECDAWNKYKNYPSAEPEIIRCKDCENWIPGYITDNDDFIPPKCGKYKQMVGHSSSDYCSLAERKADE